MRLLITGAKGQLGNCLIQHTPAGWETFFADKLELDITCEKDALRVIQDFNPTIIINAAAYTSVDKAEIEDALAYAVNVDGARFMAKAAKLCGAQFYHMSTDYVFDGESSLPYKESDPCHPINVYGDSKKKGESAVLEEYESAVILRTSWVYSEYGQNFLKSISQLLVDRKDIRVVGDQIGCPTYAGDIAKVLYKFAEIKDLPGGVYHYAGDTKLSWYDFALMIANTMQIKNASITKVTSDEFKSLAKRPKFSVMDCSKAIDLNMELSCLKEGLDLAMSKLEFFERKV
jgi:dTDP-4-dehydrorhamnose reductase